MRFILILLLCLSCQTGILSYQSPKVAVTPTVAVHSTVKVIVALDGENQKSGTAFVFQENEHESLLLTAGHVCDTGVQIEGLDLDFQIEGKWTVRVMNQSNQSWPASVVKYSKKPDLCMLSVKGHIGMPLPLAESMPEWAEEVSWIGAPRGFYGDDIAMYFKGYYSGSNVLSVFTAPGASGSPTFTKKGVFGVIVAVHSFSESIVQIVPLNQIQKFISDYEAPQTR